MEEKTNNNLYDKLTPQRKLIVDEVLKNLEEGKTFNGEAPQGWKCRNCGHVHYGEEAPEVCPTCNHPQAYFERRVENY